MQAGHLIQQTLFQHPVKPLGDPRMQAIVAAVRLLADGQPERARRVLELWSDPTVQPVPHADGKAARGMHLPRA